MTAAAPAWRIALWKALLRVRPAELAGLLKPVLGVRRREAADRSGAVFWVDPVSIFGIELLEHGEYEAQLAPLVQRLLRPGDVFVDVGANEGYFAVLAARACPGARVLAIEPQSRLQEVLRRNLERNGLRNVQVERVALGEAGGETELYLHPSTNTGASGEQRRRRLGWRREAVPSVPLDELAARRGIAAIRLMKVDCEGAEARVVRGAAGLLARRAVEFLALEYHRGVLPGAEVAATDAWLRAQGYVAALCRRTLVYHLPGGAAELAELGEVQVVPPMGG